MWKTDCFPSHKQQALYWCAGATRIGALLQSPCFNKSVEVKWILCHCDKRQMFHSNVAFAYCGRSNESLCWGMAQITVSGGTGFAEAKLNLMFQPALEKCINQGFWFAWSVKNCSVPCKNKQSGEYDVSLRTK